jgi:lambda repressor-like predicted transcriptional regulator
MSQKKPATWSSAKIKSSLEEAGISLAKLSTANGHPVAFCSRAMTSGNELGQELIARTLREFCGHPQLKAKDIWPDRYDQNGFYIKSSPGRRSLRGPIFPDLAYGRNAQNAQAA